MKSPLQALKDSLFEEKQVQVFLKRDDLLHPEFGGNKWRKLKYNLIAAKESGHKKLLTFGGAWSNHLYALAAAGKQYGFTTIGIVRGEKQEPLNHTLSFAASQGMQLHFVSRENYRRKNDPDFLEAMRKKFGDCYMLPEGGTNWFAVKGCAEIPGELDIAYDYLCCSCGTGGTLAGLIAGSATSCAIIGFSALKGLYDLEKRIESLLNGYTAQHLPAWHVNHDYHFGGYAKLTTPLRAFIDDFNLQHNILLDPVYTGKMMAGIYDLLRKDFFKKDSTIIALHTGGLQGWNGYPENISFNNADGAEN